MPRVPEHSQTLQGEARAPPYAQVAAGQHEDPPDLMLAHAPNSYRLIDGPWRGGKGLLASTCPAAPSVVLLWKWTHLLEGQWVPLTDPGQNSAYARTPNKICTWPVLGPEPQNLPPQGAHSPSSAKTQEHLLTGLTHLLQQVVI